MTRKTQPAAADSGIEVEWSSHFDPEKVGQKEKLPEQEAHAVVRSGLARYVSDKDVPKPGPSMLTREALLKEKPEIGDGPPADPTGGRAVQDVPEVEEAPKPRGNGK